MSRSAAVIGCGMGGMAAALALSRRGWDVTLFEAFEQPRPIGSGLLLQPTGLSALAALGLADEVRDAGAEVRSLVGADLRGRRVLELFYDRWRADASGLGVHRAVLFDILHRAVAASDVRLLTAARIDAVEDPQRPTLIDQNGRAHGPFDVAVVADGSHSATRARLRPRARAPLNAWGAVWANCPAPDTRFDGALAQVYDHARLMAGVLPIGRGPDGAGPLLSVFWSLKVSEMQRWADGDFAAWRQSAAQAWPALTPLLDPLESHAAFARAVYRDVSIGRWNEGACVLIGDAAHGTSPQLGQGANMAIVDGVVLAARLAATRPIPRKLSRYSTERRRHAGYYQLASRLMTPLFQSDSVVLPWLRDRLLVPFARFPLTRRLSAATLAGAAWFGPGDWRLRL